MEEKAIGSKLSPHACPGMATRHRGGYPWQDKVQYRQLTFPLAQV
jgi:hypothetical protein